MRVLLGFLILAMPAIACANIFDYIADVREDVLEGVLEDEEQHCGCIIDCQRFNTRSDVNPMPGDSESLDDDAHAERTPSCDKLSLSDDRIVPESCLQDE